MNFKDIIIQLTVLIGNLVTILTTLHSETCSRAATSNEEAKYYLTCLKKRPIKAKKFGLIVTSLRQVSLHMRLMTLHI